MANVKSQILNPITGRAKFNFLDDGTLCDAITGKTVGIIVGDQLISAITGETIASVVSDNNGNIDLSFITASSEDILKGKIGADVNGNPIEGTLVPQSTSSVEYYKCAEVGTETWSGYKANLITDTETVETPGETVVIVSGSGRENVDGTYPLTNGKTEQEAIYTKDNGYYFKYSADIQEWFIYPPSGSPTCEGFSTNDKNPWDITAWSSNLVDVNENMTVTKGTTAGSTETKEVKYYEFEETPTEGLAYGYGFTPKVGNVYDSEAMILAQLKLRFSINMPTNGLVYRHSLTLETTDNVGSGMEWSGSPQYTDIEGVKGTIFNNSVYIGDNDNLGYQTLYGQYSQSTVAFWVAPVEGTSDKVAIYSNSQNRSSSQYGYSEKILWGDDTLYYGDDGFMADLPHGLAHIVLTRNGQATTVYVNGTKKNTMNFWGDGFGAYWVLHANYWGGDIVPATIPIFMADFCMYNRTLTEEEVMQIYQ